MGFSPIQENKRSVQLMKIKECCTVESQECIAKGIYSMWISTKVIAKEAKAGQFISLFSKDGSRLLFVRSTEREEDFGLSTVWQVQERRSFRI